MKNLAMLALAGLLSLVLTACGDDKSKQPEADQTVVVQPKDNGTTVVDKTDEAKPEATEQSTTVSE